MIDIIKNIFEENKSLNEVTLKANLKNIESLAKEMIRSLKSGGKIIIFGNGGSAADSQHFAAELVGRFEKERTPLSAVSLTTNTSSITAIGNDYGYEVVFSRQLEAIAKKGDVAVGISTSGNSKNVIEAVKRAKSLGLYTASFTGGDGGKLMGVSDININVPTKHTPRVQENHILIIHIICKLIEDGIFFEK